IHDGYVQGSEAKPVEPTLKDVTLTLQGPDLGGVEAEQDVEISVAADSKLYDGRYANLGWLQELPDLIGKLTWENAALIAPSTAKALGVTDGDVVTLTVAGASVEIPVLQAPGQAKGSVRVALGYGRTAAGQIGGSKAHGVAPVG